MAVLGYAVLGHTVLGGATTTADTSTAPLRWHLGDVVALAAEVRDEDGTLTNPGAMSLLVVHEDGNEDDLTGDLVATEAGRFEVAYAPAVTGRHLAKWTATGDLAGVATFVFDVDPTELAFITLTELRDYLGATSATDPEITTALRAERAAQAQRCRVDPYTYELREALCRRVARNLAARSVPVATFTSFEGGGGTSTRVPSVDAEVRRLEAAYRRLPVG